MTSTKYISDFDKTNLSIIYDKARSLSSETIEMWMKNISNHVNSSGIKTILDLGCGTGRFTKVLADYFHCNVTGIDPSHKMSSIAKNVISAENVKFIYGSAENMNVEDKSADLIFLSQVYHHIPDKSDFVRESDRVLRNNGFVCIRNTTIDNLNSCLYPKFFPSALEIDMKRMPLRKDIINSFPEKNFSCIFAEPIFQEFANNHLEYYDKISLRGCSDLVAISDEEFDEGLSKLKEYCDSNNSKGPVTEDTDLLIFEKK